MPVRFLHHGEEWEARATGTGHGVGIGYLPSTDRWGVIFRRVTDPAREYRGAISVEDPNLVPVGELRNALDEQLVIAAIEESRFTWRPAEAISQETGIPLDQVVQTLETTSADVIVRPEPNTQGLTLYSTRAHYQKTTGFWKRYMDTLESS